ncbi:AAA family ATPase [Flavobacterium sp.]|uniref:AAA family ATPase n=1 Tax=Flavobacterium sp. TaxID=239 RepID=UPI003752F6DF
MSFKLLAIRPLEGCNEKFLKNLKENQVYQFYNDYEFQDKSENKIVDFDKYVEVKKIQYKLSVPENLYSDKINISAIVGKNGSGKSALVELLIVCLNQLSYQLKGKELNTSASLRLAKEKSDKKINCEFFYLKDNIFFVIKIKENIFENPTQINVGGNLKKFNLKDFFYTEVINYSIYAYNSLEIGVWIDELFHKNDSYQIPIVINPKRESNDNGLAGIIDVNNEQFLLKQRLLVNLLKPIESNNLDFRKIGDNISAFELNFTEKKTKDFRFFKKKYVGDKELFVLDEEIEKITDKSQKEIKKEEFWKNIPKDGYFTFEINDSFTKTHAFTQIENLYNEVEKSFNLSDKIFNIYKVKIYLLYKIIGICYKYNDYNKFIDGLHNNNLNEFINHINKIENRSHITNKLMQTINYIRFYDQVWKKYEGLSNISLNDLSDDLNKISKDNDLPLIEILPPPFFEIDILLNNDKDKSIIKLDSLSSGEKQLIHSVSSIVYHLNNLNSVKATKGTIKYDYVNIILEEIELYFHPEYQRKFVDYILKSIENANLKNIKGINILFITHSPFILSDIPKQNVMLLEVNEDKKTKPREYRGDNTFGENIHQMLTDGFFISNTKGEFVISQINNFLEFYKKNIELKEKPETFDVDLALFKEIINLIGEDYVRKILNNHIDELRFHFGDKTYLDIEEEKLKNRLIEIEKIKNAKN